MSSLATQHAEQLERLNSRFFEDADGLRAVEGRTEAVDGVVRGQFEEHFGRDGERGVAVAAVGGYGRCELFPHSDVDLLLLFHKAKAAAVAKDCIAALLASLWDSKLRVSQSVRDPGECTRLAPDNTELHISLLDTRFVAGDRAFFKEFQASTLPRFYLREQQPLLRSLAETAQRRHRRFERTLYHLEPNVKESPGGLRDYHLACWVAQLEHAGRKGIPAPEEFLPAQPDWDIREAKRFLFAVRCFLHYYHGRDNNLLSYDMQDAIANAGAGKVHSGTSGAAGLMRDYFRNCRSVHRLALHLMEEATAPSSALLGALRRRKSRLSNSDFSVSGGRLYFQDSRALETRPEMALRIFEFQARHGTPLAARTERRIREQREQFRPYLGGEGPHWAHLRQVLVQPQAYSALEAMRETGVLYALFPEFESIDCLVIRDYYHRFTVDEHTLVTIRTLKELPAAEDSLDRRYARLLDEVARPELLFLALLFHDVGKGVEGPSHEQASEDLADQAMQRIGVSDPQDRETVLYLIRKHLAMSEAMTKQDLNDIAVLERFKTGVGTLERLKLLTLVTYADTIAVNPGAVTTWRKALLWRLYLGVHGVFQRDHEDQRIEPDAEAECLSVATDEEQRERMKRFLRGLPDRYVRIRTPEQVCRHADLAATVRPGHSAVASEVAQGCWEVIVMAWDAPYLFASLCAAIASRGLGIEQAEAFSNEAGMVLDTFLVSARPGAGTRDMDQREREKLEKQLRRVADGSVDAGELLAQIKPEPYRRRDQEGSRVTFDNETSARATIFYVETADRGRLLYDLASAFSRNECDIDMVLSQTQGRRAIDTFYIRLSGEKLPGELCETVRAELAEACGEDGGG